MKANETCERCGREQPTVECRVREPEFVELGDLKNELGDETFKAFLKSLGRLTLVYGCDYRNYARRTFVDNFLAATPRDADA